MSLNQLHNNIVSELDNIAGAAGIARDEWIDGRRIGLRDAIQNIENKLARLKINLEEYEVGVG